MISFHSSSAPPPSFIISIQTNSLERGQLTALLITTIIILKKLLIVQLWLASK